MEMDQGTHDLDGLLARLQPSPTDLRRLVTSILCRPREVAWIPRRAIEGWEARDPAAWLHVRTWLASRNVQIVSV
jgi:hypothetical protein